MKEHTALLEAFRSRMKRDSVRLHGAVLMSQKKIVGEIYNPPYTGETKTRMYSTTKSVTAVAIGKLVGEGKLSLDERIVDIFSDRFDMADCHPWLKEQTVRDMLKMTTVYSKSTYGPQCSAWLESYFRAVPTHPAGTVWFYDSSGSYVLGAVVKHRTGMDFVEYLRPELCEIGVSPDAYCFQGPDGEAWASSALVATTADLAKIAYLMLEKGKWNGKQLIPEEYATDAISALVRNDDGGTVSRFDCGYGYQIWAHPDGAFAFRGLGGQLAIGFPGRDLVFSCTADTAGMHNAYDDIFKAVEDIILPAFPITDQEEYRRAQRPPVTRTVWERIRGVTFRLEENPMRITSVRFEGEGDGCRFFYTRGERELCLAFSTEKETEILFPEAYVGKKLFHPDAAMHYRCRTEGTWLSPNKLRLRVYAEDLYVGNMTLSFAFREDGRIGVKMQKNAQFFFDDFNGYAGGEAVR